MCGGQSPGRLQTDAQDFRQRQWRLISNPLLQTHPARELSNEVRHALPLVHAINRQHMVVNNRGGRLASFDQAIALTAVRQAAPRHLLLL